MLKTQAKEMLEMFWAKLSEEPKAVVIAEMRADGEVMILTDGKTYNDFIIISAHLHSHAMRCIQEGVKLEKLK